MTCFLLGYRFKIYCCVFVVVCLIDVSTWCYWTSILVSSKLKAFAGDICENYSSKQKLFDRIENTVGKEKMFDTGNLSFSCSLCIDRLGVYSFWPVCFSIYLFVCLQKHLHWPYLLISKSKGLYISHEYTLLKDFFVGMKFKVISQGQISRSQFPKNGCCGAFMFHKHILLKYIFNQLPKNFLFSSPWRRGLWKTMREKEKTVFTMLWRNISK